MKKFFLAIIKSFSFILSFIFNEKVKKTIYKIKRYTNTYCFMRAISKDSVKKNYLIGINNTFSGLENVRIGYNFVSDDNLWLATYTKYGIYTYNPKIEIGNNVSISKNCHIGAINSIKIEDNVLIGSNVLIIDHSHGNGEISNTPVISQRLYSKLGIYIGKNVWIGDNAVLLPGTYLSDNCIVGANAVVNGKFEKNSLVVGVPAKSYLRYK